MSTTWPAMLMFTTSMYQQLKRNVSTLYCQGRTVPEIIHVGRTPTTEYDLLYPNVFRQPFYNLHHDHNNRNASPYYWSYDTPEASRSLSIRPILNERESLKQFLIS